MKFCLVCRVVPLAWVAFVGISAARGAVYYQGDPTDAEQLLLQLVNRARANPQAEADRLGIGLNDGLSSGTINGDPKQPLGFHAKLIDSARAHSDWMLEVDVFEHTGVNGSDPGDRMRNAGYPFSGNWTWGENISWGGTTGNPELYDYTRQAHDNLVRSPGHRVNIMKGDFDEIGLGVRQGQFFYQGRNWNAVMTTENFAASGGTPGPLLVGVVYRDANRNQFYDPGEGVGDVTVQLDGSSDSAVTSKSGGYSLPYTGSGSVQVSFRHASFGTRTATVQRSGKNLQLNHDINEAQVTTTLGITRILNLGGAVEIDIGGTFLGNVRVERSTELTSWTLVATIPKTGPEAAYTDAVGANRAAFYRLK